MFESTGGGGWGAALDRDENAVLDDVLDEYITFDTAWNTYGVVIDKDAMTVDSQATALRRSEMRAS